MYYDVYIARGVHPIKFRGQFNHARNWDKAFWHCSLELLADEDWHKKPCISTPISTDQSRHTAGTGWCFPGKNPFLHRFCVSQRVFPMKTQKVFLKEKSKKHVMCFSDVSYK